jgi:RNA polymerase sigma-70 factor, ECF subfamily
VLPGGIVRAVAWDETVLVSRLAAGDESALAEAFDRYGPLVHGIARQTTFDGGLAEDVTQEVFVTLWQHPERFEPTRGSLRAFLGVQAQRRAIDAVRRDTRRAEREARHHRGAARVGAPGPRPAEQEVEYGELADTVRQALRTLPPEQREVVELAYFGGRTHCEIAEDLGIPVGTAKSRLRLAHAKLGSLLDRQLLEQT